MFKLLSCLNFSQIWLNLPVDHHRFGYNTKLQKKKNIDLVMMLVGGFLRKDPINPSLLPKECTHEMHKKKKQQNKDPKQLILVPTSLIQIPYLDCTIVDQCSTFLLFFNQKNLVDNL
jgi:hypothetical protein